MYMYANIALFAYGHETS